MAEQLGDVTRADSLGQEEGRGAVAKIMEADRREVNIWNLSTFGWRYGRGNRL
jgi:hypothetical protein